MTASRPVPVSPRPEGVITRGKTARNRLHGSDHFLLQYDPGLSGRAAGPFDGALCVDLGVEIDPERMEHARPHAHQVTQPRLGGFNLPLRAGERVRVIRAFNVPRHYDEDTVTLTWDRLCKQLVPGGLLVDGTSCPLGRVWTACLVRRPADPTHEPWQLEALALGANLGRGFDPGLFQTRLPKAFIHRVVPGEPVHGFVEGWKRAAQETRATAVWGRRQWFAAAAAHLAGQGYDVALRPRWLKQGWLVWRRPPMPGRDG